MFPTSLSSSTRWPWRCWVGCQPDEREESTNYLTRKSQLAIEYSHRIREESPETWVFWVHASTTARFEEGYRRIAERVKIDGWDKPEVDVLRLVSNWLCNESNGRWVMIVDNADDPNVFFNQSANHGLAQLARSLSDFLPQSLN